MQTAKYLIEKLGLKKHPEGGYFKEVYRSKEIIPKHGLHKRYSGGRNYSTSIYFLLESDDYSVFHRIKSDETWHFYAGSAVTIHMIDEKGKYETVTIGSNQEKEEVFQFTVPGGVWFAASVEKADSYALAGCTVAPGFDFDDFELAKREDLTGLFPLLEEVIRMFTRN